MAAGAGIDMIPLALYLYQTPEMMRGTAYTLYIQRLEAGLFHHHLQHSKIRKAVTDPLGKAADRLPGLIVLI